MLLRHAGLTASAGLSCSNESQTVAIGDFLFLFSGAGYKYTHLLTHSPLLPIFFST